VVIGTDCIGSYKSNYHTMTTTTTPTCEIKLENNSVLSTFVPDRISDVIVSVLASSVVDRWFEPRSVHNKD